MSNPGSGTLTRLLTAIVLLSLTMSLIWIPVLQPGLLIFVGVVVTCGLYEFYALTHAKDDQYRSYLAIPMGGLIVLSAYSGDVMCLNATMVIVALIVAFSHIVRPPATMGTIIPSIFGLVYIAWSAAHFMLLHSLDRIGPALTTLLIVTVALSDSGAFFVGRSFGKHKLAPVVSPNKTWEGAIGGFFFSTLAMVALYFLRQLFDWTAFPDWSLLRYGLIGATLSVASQIGDLSESAFKRDAGVKDSGTLLPGHGGALDRCDGLLFAVPILYYLTLL